MAANAYWEIYRLKYHLVGFSRKIEISFGGNLSSWLEVPKIEVLWLEDIKIEKYSDGIIERCRAHGCLWTHGIVTMDAHGYI